MLVGVPKGSRFTSQVCCRTWFYEAMQCCAVERRLDFESVTTTQRLTLAPPEAICSSLISMSIHTCIQKIRTLDQIVCHSALKTDVIPGKKGIKKWKRERRTREGVKDQRTFLRLPFTFLLLFRLFFHIVLRSTSLFPPHVVVAVHYLLTGLLVTGLSRTLGFAAVLYVLLWLNVYHNENGTEFIAK